MQYFQEDMPWLDLSNRSVVEGAIADNLKHLFPNRGDFDFYWGRKIVIAKPQHPALKMHELELEYVVIGNIMKLNTIYPPNYIFEVTFLQSKQDTPSEGECRLVKYLQKEYVEFMTCVNGKLETKRFYFDNKDWINVGKGVNKNDHT